MKTQETMQAAIAEWNAGAGNVSETEARAARAVLSGNVERMIFALAAIDREAGRSISNYSNLAAVSADRTDYFRANGDRTKAREYHAERTIGALEEMVEPRTYWSIIRESLIVSLRERGVKIGGGENPSLFVANEICSAINTYRKTRGRAEHTTFGVVYPALPALPESFRAKQFLDAAGVMVA